MSRPNHLAVRAAPLAALALMSMAGAAAAQNCPGNFFDILESKADTTAAKQGIGNACKGRDVTIRGVVLDIAKRGDVFELLAVPKRREAPLDLLLSVFPYYFVFAMVLVTMEGFRKSWWDGALTLLVGSLAVFSMLQPRLTIWTRRSTAGNV